MKEGDLVKVLFTENMFGYGILTNDRPPEIGLDGYREVWIFKYPVQYGDMPPQKSLYIKERITHIKTFEDW